MRKIYSLLLLGAFLLLGAQSAWGYTEMYIRGEFTTFDAGDGLAMTQTSTDVWEYDYTATSNGWKAFKFVATNTSDWSNQWGASKNSAYPLTLGYEYETYGNDNNANIQINLTSGCVYHFVLNTYTNKYTVTSPQSKTIYFYNLLGWSKIYVNLYTSAYFDPTNGSGNYNIPARNYTMTRVGTTNYWKCDYTGSYSVVTFCDTWWDNQGNFSSGKCTYRTDFTTSAPVFIPQNTSNETKNGCAYYSNGVWNGYDETSFARAIATGSYGTICSPVNATITGATLYSITGVNAGGTILYISPEEGEYATKLTAGTAYFYKATADEQTITLVGTTISATPSTTGGKYGTYTETEVAKNSNYCVLSNNTLLNVTTDGVKVKANRVYIKKNELGLYNPGSSSAPGRPIVAMPLEPESPTDIQAIESSEKAVKFIQNGQLLIMRDGVVYDATGRVVR